MQRVTAPPCCILPVENAEPGTAASVRAARFDRPRPAPPAADSDAGRPAFPATRLIGRAVVTRLPTSVAFEAWHTVCYVGSRRRFAKRRYALPKGVRVPLGCGVGRPNRRPTNVVAATRDHEKADGTASAARNEVFV